MDPLGLESDRAGLAACLREAQAAAPVRDLVRARVVSLLLVLYAVALCAMVSGVFATAACAVAALWPSVRPAVTTHALVLMTLWGTALIFGGVILRARS